MKERLQKIIAHAGIASRRKAEILILEGKVTVNGQVVTQLGTRADPAVDHIKVNRKLIRPEIAEYYVVNKPAGVLSSASDPKNRPLVTQLVPSSKRLYPAGRLDFNSEGVVILTNDGELARRITTAGCIPKVYRVKVQGKPGKDKIERLCAGISLKDGTRLSKCRIRLLKTGNNTWFEVVLYQGKNRQIRRMFEEVGHAVMKLRRVAVGPVRIGELRPGQWRKLTAVEVALLKGGQEHGANTRRQ